MDSTMPMSTMDNNKFEDFETAMDVKLFIFIGLYQFLCPFNSGNFRNWYRTILISVLWLIFGVQCMQIVGLYFVLNDLEWFMNRTCLILYGLMCLYKLYVMVMNADKLWSVLDVAGYAFTSSSRHNSSKIQQCRTTVSVLLRTFTVISCCTLFIWVIHPSLQEEYVSIINMDGTVSKYRTTVSNLWFPVSNSVYNSSLGWTLIYTIEAVVCTINTFTWLIFDCYVFTVCFVLKAHLCTVSAGFEALGRRHQSETSHRHSLGNSTTSDDFKLDSCYDNLIIIIKDNQKVIKKLVDFFDIIRPAILVQIFFGSSSVIILIYLTIRMYTLGWSILSAPVLKYFSGFASTSMELYIFCYVFDNLEVAKSAVNFGLYSSNWTGMNLKFKKTLLLAMSMNSNQKLLIQTSPKSILNLMMFSKVMHMSYSIVSVLLHTTSTQKTLTE